METSQAIRAQNNRSCADGVVTLDVTQLAALLCLFLKAEFVVRGGTPL